MSPSFLLVFLQCAALDDPNMHEAAAPRVCDAEIFALADYEVRHVGVGAGPLAFVVHRS